MTSQLGQWGKAISDLDFAHAKAEKPPWYKALGGGVEANAMEIWSHKQKAKEMREEMRQYISLYYGPSAYQGDHLIFLGNTWSAILQFLHVTNNAEEVRNMFHSQLNTREQVKVTQNKKVI